MPDNTAPRAWEEYRSQELKVLTPVLEKLGYVLDAVQPHTEGERYLMHAVTTTSGRKLILLGTRSADGERVVIKSASHATGKHELEHERECRRVLHKIRFAHRTFLSPKELFFGERSGRLISIQQYIPQEQTFLSRPVAEQFSIALASFKAQEGAHATTYAHERLVRRTFGSLDATAYLERFSSFSKHCAHDIPEEKAILDLLGEALGRLTSEKELIEQYSGFLTHTDFVPHNFRVYKGAVYLLDHSSLRFGNKYEGWARFVNFMTLHNPSLAAILTEYVRRNRTPEEMRSLELMRLYRLGEIISYYADTLKKCSGNLRTLNEARVHFWGRVLAAVLSREEISPEVVEEYTRTRDSLRSPGELLRQQGLL